MKKFKDLKPGDTLYWYINGNVRLCKVMYISTADKLFKADIAIHFRPIDASWGHMSRGVYNYETERIWPNEAISTQPIIEFSKYYFVKTFIEDWNKSRRNGF